MKKGQSTILYLFIIIIILVGLALLIFKKNFTNQFLSYSNIDTSVNLNSGVGSLKLDILRDSRIKSLKNYVSVFDYDSLDKSQDALAILSKAQAEVIISNPEEISTSTKNVVTTNNNFIRVRVGNSNPFIVNKIGK